MVQIRRVRKFRMYDKYRDDIWGWLMYKRTKKLNRILLELLYRKRLLFGYNLKNKLDYKRIWKIRKGLGRRRSIYKKKLHEKQKIQYFYHILREYKLKNFYKKVKREKGILEDNFAGILESRVLTILYRIGLINSMRVGSQLITHHGVTVEGRRIKKYNYTLRPGQMIDLIPEDCERMDIWKKKTTRFMKTDELGRKLFLKKKKKEMTKARDSVFHRDLKFSMYYEKDRLAHRNIKFYRKIMYPGLIPGRRQKNRVEKWRKRTRIPDYLEISYKLRKVMLVYRPKAHEVFYPFEANLNEVVDYLSR